MLAMETRNKSQTHIHPILPLEILNLVIDEACRSVTNNHRTNFMALLMISKSLACTLLPYLYRDVRLVSAVQMAGLAEALTTAPLVLTNKGFGGYVKSIMFERDRAFNGSGQRPEIAFWQILSCCQNLESIELDLALGSNMLLAFIAAFRHAHAAQQMVGQSLTLKRLALFAPLSTSGDDSPTRSLSELITCLGPELLDLELSAFPLSEPSGFLASLRLNTSLSNEPTNRLHPGLKHLKLGPFTSVTSQVLLGIPACCPNLEDLNILYTVRLKDGPARAVDLGVFTALLNPTTLKTLRLLPPRGKVFRGSFGSSLDRLPLLETLQISSKFFKQSYFKHLTVQNLKTLSLSISSIPVAQDFADPYGPNPQLEFDSRRLGFAKVIVENLEALGFNDRQDVLDYQIDELILLKRIHSDTLKMRGRGVSLSADDFVSSDQDD